MFFKELVLLDLDTIYNMPDGEYKEAELIKYLLTQEYNRIKDSDKKNAAFIDQMLSGMVTDSDNITGNNPDF